MLRCTHCHQYRNRLSMQTDAWKLVYSWAYKPHDWATTAWHFCEVALLSRHKLDVHGIFFLVTDDKKTMQMWPCLFSYSYMDWWQLFSNSSAVFKIKLWNCLSIESDYTKCWQRFKYNSIIYTCNWTYLVLKAYMYHKSLIVSGSCLNSTINKTLVQAIWKQLLLCCMSNWRTRETQTWGVELATKKHSNYIRTSKSTPLHATLQY